MKVIDSLNTSPSTQRLQILALFKQHKAINTIEFRNEFGIISNAPRIFELKDKGHRILTHLEDVITQDGRLHKRVARYHYFDTPPAMTIAWRKKHEF
jgi:hypothetical protein